ncbi:MAG: TIGR04376 family protein, partial [Merismopedia sp. SIO2A8]|nr:TIGR04376 family protein [Merismopedia sp. SIO2A8]
MGLFEDFSRVLETRLDEFLKNNPHLELQAIDEQLREQEAETTRLLASFRLREKQLEAEILSTAKEVQRWHVRVDKAKKANRYDLVQPAEEREAALLRQGNQLWGQMKGVKDRIKQTMQLNQQIKQRRKDVKAKLAETETARTAAQAKQWQTAGWNQTADYSFRNPSTHSHSDDLEKTFSQWEMDEEVERMKRDL